jgi:hypothetical protein
MELSWNCLNLLSLHSHQNTIENLKDGVYSPTLGNRELPEELRQEVPHLSWNPTIYYCAHKSPQIVSIPSQMNAGTLCLFELASSLFPSSFPPSEVNHSADQMH